MADLRWDDTMSVGVPAVDADHRVLIDLINRLDSSVEGGDGRAVIGTVLNSLVDYIAHHFAREEKVMEACGYPHLEDHRKIHSDLAERVVDVQCRFLDNEQEVIGAEVLGFLKDWLRDHILGQDMDFRPLAEGNEAAAAAADTVRAVRPAGLPGSTRWPGRIGSES